MCLYASLAPDPLTCLALRPHFRPRKPPGVLSLRLQGSPTGGLTASPIYNAGYQLGHGHVQP